MNLKEIEVTLSIVIINFRTPKLTIDTLVSLFPQMPNQNARIIVVDNNSQDDSSAIIKKWLNEHDTESNVIFIQSDKNDGFASGNNIGIRALKAKFYLLLNSDTIVRDGAVDILMDTILTNPKIGLVSPRLEWPNGVGQESCFKLHSLISEFLSSAQTGFIDKIFSQKIVAIPLNSNSIKIEWTSFACVLIRAEVFNQIGYLDDGYFMYFEDVEFCARLSRNGWEIAHNSSARVVHLRGGSSSVKSNSIAKKRLPKYYYESRARFFYQLNGQMGLVLANFMWIAGRMISRTRQLLGRSDKKAIDSQWIDIWTNCFTPLKKYTHPDKK